MNHPLLSRLPETSTSASDLLDRFLLYVSDKGLELYEAQEEAILALFEGKNVILNTPTGSGKSLVATALHFQSLATGRRSVYTCPIKALVNEKFLALCQDFGPDNVGMITGDASVNPQAPIICCTAEILSNQALREGVAAKVDDVIMDEFHFYSDRERGVAWQVPLLTLAQARFLLMSATLGDTSLFERSLTELNAQETVVVRSTHRPVPLDFTYQEIPLHETIAELIAAGKAPIYVVSFTQRECAEQAQNLLSVDFCTKDEKKRLTEALEGARFTSPYGKEIQKLLKHGIGIHHAGLLPKYRVLVERLAQQGLLKVISGTDTLGVGVNIPIRTVLLTKLCKFDGEKTAILSVRDFHQICGRAGRKGYDDQGSVVVQAPEHVIENLRMEQKAANDPKKLRKLVKKKPPEKGYVAWNKDTFQKLTTSQPEPLVSRFQISHGMLLNVLGRDDGGCHAMRQLVRTSHETPVAKRQLMRVGFQLFRSLLDRKILEWGSRENGQKHLRVNVDLQQDFSLNQTLALYLLDTLKLLDPSAPDYALDLLSLVESILENPDLILRKQLDRLKTEKLVAMKQEGLEYEERMAELEKLEYPKPNRDFIYDTFNAFAAKHPWVGQENIRPKSVAREMYETFQSFVEYVREYDLQRAEGLLLRYLSEVYKVLVQTVPDYIKSDEVRDMEVYFGTMIRQIDSSLLDEWERLKNPAFRPVERTAETSAFVSGDVTTNKHAFEIRVRNDVFRLVRAIASRSYDEALTLIEPDGWSVDKFAEAMEGFYLERERILTDRQARSPQHVRVQSGNGFLRIEQTLIDSEGFNDWQLVLQVDLPRSAAEARPVMLLETLGAI